MSLVDELLTILTSYHGGYKLMRMKMMGRDIYYSNRAGLNNIKEDTLKVTLSRLKKKGLVDNRNRVWRITDSGRKFFKNKISKKIKIHFRPDPLAKKKNMVIAFDIPESDRKKRDWLRTELVNLSFSPLQKSVWFGPAPLPQEFIKSLNELSLIKFMKFFEAIEKDLI